MAATYGFSKQVFLVNGVPIDGWMDGDDTIGIVYREDAYTDVVGNDGKMAIAENPDKSAEVTINLKQTSASNAYLNALLNTSREAARIPIIILWKGTDGSDLGTGSDGYIKKHADITRGRSILGQQWVFVVERMDLVLGTVS